MTLPEGLLKPSPVEPSMDPILQLEDALSNFRANQLKQYENLDLFQRLLLVCRCIRSNFGSGSSCMFQPWLSYASYQNGADLSMAQNQLFASPVLGLDGSGEFKEFRAKSCLTPLSHRNSMPGRVWRTGALQVVQSLRIIPQGLHPRSNLSDEDLDKVAETLYIPVYDVRHPTKGTVSVLEVFLSSKAVEPMLVADFISFITSSLAAVNLSLSDPQPQPIHRSTLCGRRARPDAGSEEDVKQPGGGAASVAAVEGEHAQASKLRERSENEPHVQQRMASDVNDVATSVAGSTGVGTSSAFHHSSHVDVAPGTGADMTDGEEKHGSKSKVRKISASIMRSKSMHSVHAQHNG